MAQSCAKLLLQILANNNVRHEWNKSDRVLRVYNPTGGMNEVLFEGCDDPEKLKSLAGITSAWIEEFTEIDAFEFIKIDLIVREEKENGYIQLICSANPDEAQGYWIKERFFDHTDPRAFIHHSTVDDNPIDSIREGYRKILDSLDDPVYTSIYRLGVWAAAKGRIYNWDVQPLPEGMAFDDIWYGGDFGFSVDPAAVVKIYRRADEYWLEEKLYQTGLTNSDIATTLRPIVGTALTVWDSAEQKSIEELRRTGLCVVGADKGPESVKAGIDLLKSRKIHIVEGSNNLIDESRTYKWKMDGNGNSLPMPVKFRDHLLDAARYGITYDAFRAQPSLRRL